MRDGPAGVEIRRLRTADEVRAVAPLFDAMYRQFEEMAGRAMLRDGGFEAWIGLYDKLADRNRLVVSAASGGATLGFIEGLIRAAPSHAPPALLGFVAHLYVVPEARGTGVARTLVTELLGWFAEKGAADVELHVVAENRLALQFWQNHGFQPDLFQLRLSK